MTSVKTIMCTCLMRRHAHRNCSARVVSCIACMQAISMGHQAVAEQCRAIEGWRAEIGKPKLQSSALSTAALEARIEGLCRERLEKAYKDINGAPTAFSAVTVSGRRCCKPGSAEHLHVYCSSQKETTADEGFSSQAAGGNHHVHVIWRQHQDCPSLG